MAVSFRSVGAQAQSATVASIAPGIGAGSVPGDILIACIYGQGNQVVTGTDGGWSSIVEFNNGTTQRLSVMWKAMTLGLGSQTFTKPVDDNLLFMGIIATYRGCDPTSPVYGAAASQSANASSDTVTYATFNPSGAPAYIVAVGIYGNDLTTAGAMSGTDPTFGLDVDVETTIGDDASIFIYSGQSSGAATGSRTHSTTSTLDAINSGTMFGLRAFVHPPKGTHVNDAVNRSFSW